MTNLDIASFIRKRVTELQKWVALQLIKLYHDVSDGRWPTYTTFDKCLFLFKRHLDKLIEKGELSPSIVKSINENLNIKFEKALAGPYLIDPPLDYLISVLEIEGFVKVEIEIKPYTSNEEPLFEYYRKLYEISDNTHEYPKYRKYFIELVEGKQLSVSEELSKELKKVLDMVKADLEEIKRRYGRLEEKYLNEYVYRLTREEQV